MTIKNSRSGMGNLNRRVVVLGTGFYNKTLERSQKRWKPIRIWVLIWVFNNIPLKLNRKKLSKFFILVSFCDTLLKNLLNFTNIFIFKTPSFNVLIDSYLQILKIRKNKKSLSHLHRVKNFQVAGEWLHVYQSLSTALLRSRQCPLSIRWSGWCSVFKMREWSKN